MKRIGMLLDNPFTGDNRVVNQARLLQQNGFEVFVLALNYGQHSPIEDLEGVRIRRVPVPEKWKNYMFALYHWLPLFNAFWKKHGAAFIREFNIEAIHAHDLYMGEAGAELAAKFNLPLVIDLHENYPAAVLNYQWTHGFPGKWVARPHRWQQLEASILAKAKRIVVLSEHHRKLLCNKYPQLNREHFVIYPNVPDHEQLLSYPVGANPLPHPESKWLFYFGVIAERRGVYTALDALKLLRAKGHDVRLLLAGNVNNAERETFERRIQDPEINDFLLHKPWIDISEFPTYAAACTAGLSPIFSGAQHDIGVANKVFQYMLMGLPVIASDSVAQAEIVRESSCGVVFKSGDASDLARAIEVLLHASDAKQKWGASGNGAVVSKYNLVSTGKELVSGYYSL
ncbi:MAG: glycosyltransferase [Cryomorphaceae bacterium]|nr:MAG: glycosyltransferase [Cryomorphaceae bacterium]